MNMGSISMPARFVAQQASVCTESPHANAKSAEDHHYVSTERKGTGAKSVEGQASANTDGQNTIAQIATISLVKLKVAGTKVASSRLLDLFKITCKESTQETPKR